MNLDTIVGQWLVLVGAGGFLLWLAARVYHATRDAAHKTSPTNLRRVITGEEYAHIWHEARGCECEDDDCWWCAARTESIVRHPAGKGLRGEEL